MQGIGHDFRRQVAVLLEKHITNVTIKHGLIIAKLTDSLVDRRIVQAQRIQGLCAAWKNAEQQDFGIGCFFVNDLNDSLNAGRYLAGVLLEVTCVVGADHDHGDLWRHVVELPVLQTPEDVLGSITTDPEIDSMTGCVTVGPDFLSVSFPSMRDRITDEDQFNVSLGDPLIHFG